MHAERIWVLALWVSAESRCHAIHATERCRLIFSGVRLNRNLVLSIYSN